MKPTLEAALKRPITKGRSLSETRSDSRALEMESVCLKIPATKYTQIKKHVSFGPKKKKKRQNLSQVTMVRICMICIFKIPLITNSSVLE